VAEIDRILDTPFDRLERNEINVRKLLNKFHDNPRLVSAGGRKDSGCCCCS
jgi:hypothetical protein